MASTDNSREQTILAELAELIDRTPPRQVPVEWLRAARDPSLGLLSVSVGILLFVMMLLLVNMTFLSDTPPDFQSLFWLVALVVVMTGVFVWTVSTNRMTRRIIATGRLYKGKITKISTMVQPVVWRTITEVTLAYTDEQGMTHTVKDALGDEAGVVASLTYKNGDKVDIIASPDIPGRAILVMKLPYQYIT